MPAYETPVGARPDTDQIPMATEVVVTITLVDGTTRRYVLTGLMRGFMEVDTSPFSRAVAFRFDDPESMAVIHGR